jgi:hypothetical protein
MPNALYALQGVLIHARAMAYKSAAGSELGDLLDTAEMLPRYIASDSDETESFRRYLAEIAAKHKCAFVLERFDEPMPQRW